MVKRSTGCKRSSGEQVIVGAKGVRFPDADAICKHINQYRSSAAGATGRSGFEPHSQVR